MERITDEQTKRMRVLLGKKPEWHNWQESIGRMKRIVDEVPALLDELEALRATVKTLPVTADGVFVVPGMITYQLHAKPVRISRDGEMTRITRVEWIQVGENTYAGDNYSTMESAEAAGRGGAGDE